MTTVMPLNFSGDFSPSKKLDFDITPQVKRDRVISTFTRNNALLSECFPLVSDSSLNYSSDEMTLDVSEMTESKEVSFDTNSDDEMGDNMSSNLRGSLKIIRDPTKTAFDILPTGESLGAFANKHAVDRYSRKVENKRERARETRKKKRHSEIICNPAKKRKTLKKDEFEFFHPRKSVSSEITAGNGTH